MVFSLSRALLPAALVVACASASAERSAPQGLGQQHEAAPAGDSHPLVGLEDADWGWLKSKRFGLSVPLPERARWIVDDERDPWLIATHAGSRSELRVRTWRAPRTATPDDCQAQARLWRPALPPIAEDTALAERRLAVPPGYTTLLHVGVRRVGGEMEGFVLAFGATVGKCFSAVYTTRASGPGMDDAVGKRLAMVDGALGQTSERSIDDRVTEHH